MMKTGQEKKIRKETRTRCWLLTGKKRKEKRKKLKA